MSKTASTAVLSYLKRCKNPAPTTRLLDVVSRNSGICENTVRRTLYHLKSNGTITMAGKQTNKSTGCSESTWSIS